MGMTLMKEEIYYSLQSLETGGRACGATQGNTRVSQGQREWKEKVVKSLYCDF